MKKASTFLAAAALILLGYSKPLVAGQVSVTYDSVAAQTAKNGDTLDGSVKFFFADEKDHGHGVAELTAHASGNGAGRDKEGKCRWALLGAFLRMQAQAKEAGKHKIVGITTASSADTDSSNTSGSRGACYCNAKAFTVTSLIKYHLAD
jgi:hypothetical protein